MIVKRYTILLLLLLVTSVTAVVTPVWQTTGYTQSSSGRIINGDACACTIGNSTAPIVKMSYVGSFPSVPYSVYGVSRYEGSDFLGSEMYEVTRTAITNRDITFKARVLGISRIWVLEVRYFVLDKTFAYFVNSFDNVPVNLSAGAISNISTYSLTTKTYTNTINFNTQASGSGSPYTSFTGTLSDNKIVLFPTTLYLAGTEEPSGATTFNPIKLSISASAVTSSTYKISVQLGINATITKLHFSIFMFQYTNIFNSNIYKMVYEKICYTSVGGNYGFPPQFQNSFISAMAQFSATRTNSVIHFQMNVDSGGATMIPSAPRDVTMTTLSKYCYNMLYLKHWFCPGGRTFDPITEMCTECPLIPGCITCVNSTYCSACATSLNYFVTGTGTCQLCSITGCVTCSDATTCAVCDTTLNYVLSSPTCTLCDTANNFFPDATGTSCPLCGLSDCITCSSLTACAVCDTANLFYVGPSSTCLLCDPAQNYFFDPVTLDCNLCTISQCVSCTNLTACSLCNATNDFTVNPTTGLCQICSLVGCVNCTDIYTCGECNLTANYILTMSNTCLKCTGGLFANATSSACEACTLTECTLCASLTVCITCNTANDFYVGPSQTCLYCDSTTNDFINMTTLDCQHCTLDHCLTCSSLTQCTACDTGADYFLNTATGLCQSCAVIQAGCLDCNDFTTCVLCQSVGYIQTAGNTCQPICGDGLVRSYQQCDDGNLTPNDGCSASCTIELGYICSLQPSNCTIDHNAQENSLASIQRVGCNSFKAITIKPPYPYNKFPQTVSSMTTGVTISSIAQNDTHFTIIAAYDRDIEGVPIVFGFNPGVPLTIEYTPTMPALYYTPKECETAEEVANLYLAVEVISYAILIVSILSCKIVGLELFGVLQLSYFTLSSHSFLNIYLQPLSKFRSFNGLNLPFSPQSSTIPSNLSTMQVNASFINNFNIMLLLLAVEFIVGLVMYIVAIKTQREKLEQIALRLMKQGFITLVLFNIFNISFSAGVHWKYASPLDPGYAGSSFLLYGTLLGMVVAVIAMEVTGKSEYGEFKKKFKRTWVCEVYIPLTILYRMALGFYIGYQSDYQESTLLILSISIAFMMYTMINLPFKNVYQNYRCSLVHLTMLYTLLTTNYYRSMKSNTKMSVKGRIYGPAIIELILILATICVSFAVLSYQIYYLVRQWWERRKIDGGSQKSNNDNQPIIQPPEINQTQENINLPDNQQITNAPGPDQFVANFN